MRPASPSWSFLMPTRASTKDMSIARSSSMPASAPLPGPLALASLMLRAESLMAERGLDQAEGDLVAVPEPGRHARLEALSVDEGAVAHAGFLADEVLVALLPDARMLAAEGPLGVVGREVDLGLAPRLRVLATDEDDLGPGRGGELGAGGGIAAGGRACCAAAGTE